MQAISQDELGGPEVLKVVTFRTPEPGTGEITVRVHAAGVNPVDAMNRESGLFIGQAPFVLGWDVSGTVEAVGPGVTLYTPGDEVFGMLPFPHGHGAHAQYAAGPSGNTPGAVTRGHESGIDRLYRGRSLSRCGPSGNPPRAVRVSDSPPISGPTTRRSTTPPPTSPRSSVTSMPSWRSSAAAIR